MALAIQDLINVLQEMTEEHRQLLELAELKKQAIIHNEVSKLNQCVNKESKCIRQMAELEEKRIFEMSRYLVGKGYRPNPAITVSELAKIVVRVEEKQALLLAQSELVAILERLKAANDLNQQLIQQSLLFIDHWLGLFTGEQEDEGMYHNPHAHGQAGSRAAWFDTRA